MIQFDSLNEVGTVGSRSQSNKGVRGHHRGLRIIKTAKQPITGRIHGIVLFAFIGVLLCGCH